VANGKLICSQCGAEFPRNWRQAWGKHPDTHGLGPAMVCCELVPNGFKTPEGELARGICGGILVPATGAPAEGARTWQGQ